MEPNVAGEHLPRVDRQEPPQRPPLTSRRLAPIKSLERIVQRTKTRQGMPEACVHLGATSLCHAEGHTEGLEIAALLGGQPKR